MNHSWSDPDRTDPLLTVRTCRRCGMRRLTDKSRAAKGRYTIRFASADGLAYHGEGTPPCIMIKNPPVRLRDRVWNPGARVT